MAKDQTLVAVDLAGMCVEHGGELVNALLDMNEVYNWATDADINFTTYETDIQANPPTQHVDGAMLNQVLANVVPGIITYLESTTVSAGDYSGETYWAMLQMVRRS